MNQIKLIETTLKHAKFDAMLNGWLPDEKIDLYTLPECDSAYWQYQPPHKIVIGHNSLQKVDNSSDVEGYIASLFYHELGHAKWTDRDISKTIKYCESKNVSFRLHNLFEDARVEHLWRKTTGRFFNWMKYNTKDYLFSTIHPEELFFF